MSVGPLGGLAGSAAGTPLAQTKGSEVERRSRTSKTSSAACRTTSAPRTPLGSAKPTARITRPRSGMPTAGVSGRSPPASPTPSSRARNQTAARRRAKDATGKTGSLLDLSG